MINDLVSIVIPVYNVENFLKKCIDSVIEQTYRNIEIILVDDGSTDDSGNICDNYLQMDNRIRVIHKSNGGLSDARNKGIEASNGKYIVFIDSDDWIDKKYIEKFYTIIKDFDADLVIGRLTSVSDTDNHIETVGNITSSYISKEDVYKSMFLEQGIEVSACAKIYKKSIFKDLRFPYGKLYEDFLTFDKIIEEADKIVETNYNGYYYLSRPGSIMRSKFKEDRMVLLDKAEYYINFSKEKYPSLEIPSIKRYICCCFQLLSLSITDNKFKEYTKLFRKKILYYKKTIFKTKYFSKREKIQTLLLCFGLTIYKFVFYIYRYIKYNHN